MATSSIRGNPTAEHTEGIACVVRSQDNVENLIIQLHGGKPVNVSNSFTPVIGKRLAVIKPKFQRIVSDWKRFEEHDNRLQTRITKAVKEQKRYLVRQKKQPQTTLTMNNRSMQMLHVLILSGKEICRVVLRTLCHGSKTAARYRNEMLGKREKIVSKSGGIHKNEKNKTLYGRE